MKTRLIAGNSQKRQSAAKPERERSTTILYGVGLKRVRNAEYLERDNDIVWPSIER